MGSHYGVEVVQNRSVFLIVVVERLLISKGNLSAVAESVLKDAVETGAGVKATSFRRGRVGQRSGIVAGGEQSVATGEKVYLLSRSESGKQKKRTHGRDSRELSQIQPPYCVSSRS